MLTIAFQTYSLVEMARCASFLQEDGADISPWHDVPLYNEDGTLNFFCEIPKDTTAKFEVAMVRSPWAGLLVQA